MVRQHKHKPAALEVVQHLDDGKMLVAVEQKEFESVKKALEALKTDYSIAQYVFSDFLFVECTEQVADFLARWYAPAHKQHISDNTLHYYKNQYIKIERSSFDQGSAWVKFK